MTRYCVAIRPAERDPAMARVSMTFKIDPQILDQLKERAQRDGVLPATAVQRLAEAYGLGLLDLPLMRPSELYVEDPDDDGGV